MLKLLLFSVIFCTFVLPASAARAKDPRRALRSLLGTMLLVEVLYAVFLLKLYPRLL